MGCCRVKHKPTCTPMVWPTCQDCRHSVKPLGENIHADFFWHERFFFWVIKTSNFWNNGLTSRLILSGLCCDDDTPTHPPPLSSLSDLFLLSPHLSYFAPLISCAVRTSLKNSCLLICPENHNTKMSWGSRAVMKERRVMNNEEERMSKSFKSGEK